jgi:arabinogalactan oligomer / maltooligosaccharide transport system substrate-binding protein
VSNTSSKSLVSLLSVAVLLLSGCVSTVQTQGTTNGTTASSGVNLTIWIDGELSGTVQTIAEQLQQNSGHTLSFVEKDFSTLEAEISAAGDNAPDLFIGSSEWTDRLASTGLIAALGVSGLSGFDEAVTKGTSFQGELYGVPYSIENLALVCNGSRVKSQPGSANELVEAGFKLVLSPGGDPYTLFPIQSSFGVLPLGLDESGDWTEATGLTATRGQEFAKWMTQNRALIRELDYSSAITALVDGVEPCLVTGPWSIPELRQRADFDIRVYEIPSFGGEKVQAFSSARAVFVSAKGKNLEAAKEAANYFATEPVQLLIHNETGRVPAMERVASGLDDEIVKGFSKAAASTLVLPGNNAMQNTWVPWTKAINSLLRSDENSDQIWDQLLAELKTAIG